MILIVPGLLGIVILIIGFSWFWRDKMVRAAIAGIIGFSLVGIQIAIWYSVSQLGWVDGIHEDELYEQQE